MRILSLIIIWHCDTMVISIHNAIFTDMNDAEDSIQVIGFKAFFTGERVLKLLTGFILNLNVNKEKIKEYIGETRDTFLSDS